VRSTLTYNGLCHSPSGINSYGVTAQSSHSLPCFAREFFVAVSVDACGCALCGHAFCVGIHIRPGISRIASTRPRMSAYRGHNTLRNDIRVHIRQVAKLSPHIKRVGFQKRGWWPTQLSGGLSWNHKACPKWTSVGLQKPRLAPPSQPTTFAWMSSKGLGLPRKRAVDVQSVSDGGVMGVQEPCVDV